MKLCWCEFCMFKRNALVWLCICITFHCIMFDVVCCNMVLFRIHFSNANPTPIVMWEGTSATSFVRILRTNVCSKMLGENWQREKTFMLHISYLCVYVSQQMKALLMQFMANISHLISLDCYSKASGRACEQQTFASRRSTCEQS